MKIRWPSLWFGPINLWNAPHQPALEDTMAAAENDSVLDQLCARIDELEREKEVLVAQMDQAEEGRDALAARLEDSQDWEEVALRFQAERDALAAHAKRLERRGDQLAIELRDWLANYGPDDETERMLEVWAEAKSQRPETNLARLKAEWQAEALEESADEIEDANCPCADMLRGKAAELHRQAEEAPDAN